MPVLNVLKTFYRDFHMESADLCQDVFPTPSHNFLSKLNSIMISYTTLNSSVYLMFTVLKYLQTIT